MNRLLCTLLATANLLLSGMTTFADDASKAESEKLQGIWSNSGNVKYQYRTESNPEVIALIRGGELKKGEVIFSRLLLEVKDGNFSFSDEDLKKGTRKSIVKLDATKTPKEIDLMVEKDKSFLGIYKLEGDILTICIGDQKNRPTAFDISKGGQALIQYKKK